MMKSSLIYDFVTKYNLNVCLINQYSSNLLPFKASDVVLSETPVRSFKKANSKAFFSFFLHKEDEFLWQKLLSCCVKKGYKQLAYRMVFRAFMLLRRYFSINPFLLVKLAAIRVEPFMDLQKIPLGKKEMIFPRMLPHARQVSQAVHGIVNQAFQNRKHYRDFAISLAFAVTENALVSSALVNKAQNANRIAFQHKFNFLRRKKRPQRFRLLRKMK